jgi:hypothetical protein
MRDTGVQVGPTLSDAARTPAFVNLLRRGTEWAATADVTLPLVDWSPPPSGRRYQLSR